ncbi:lanthionine synthetase LanC family protein [Coxiella burnetii]|uniref:lanthionine synthetase LanC family protein n=2 Tax=Coxiella burnetii TaxID=777 RepID=UPI00202B0D1B|nr:lanthionine synthetase LanC family protein [Coxiella burnetii]
MREHAQTDNKFMIAWCHGAPGIGLARLNMQTIWDDPLMGQEIDRAMQTTFNEGFGFHTNLCHGDLGNLDFLLEVSQRNPSKNRQLAYQARAAFVVERIKKDGISLQIKGTMPLPGLMLGLAGVAYQLMRIAKPQEVPSILLLTNGS